MTRPLSRRGFLAGAATAAAATAWPRPAAAQEAKRLVIGRRTIEINREPAAVYSLLGPGGKPGIVLEPGERFRVTLENDAGLPTLIHWHGQTPPPAQDGVPDLSQPLLPPGQRYAYDYAARPGTHWMHSHEGLHEQLLMAAPLIVRERDGVDAQEHTILLHDFTFTDAAALFAKLGAGEGEHAGHAMPAAPAPAAAAADPHAGHAMVAAAPAAAAAPAPAPSRPHLHDIEYDAYLANDRLLDDPEIVRVESGGRVRLRIINAATATAFIIDTGALGAQVLAVDGNPVLPVEGTQFPLAMGQRIDLLLKLPRGEGVYPVLARREGETERTGVLLATRRAQVVKLALKGQRKAAIAGLDLEVKLRAKDAPPRRPVDRRLEVVLGEKPPYVWTLNGRTHGQHQPLAVKQGERVQLTFVNPTGMMHPMHLHGHHFQVVAVNGRRIDGAVRDTVIVPALGGRVSVAFDADNPGEWAVHCHNLYHMAAGMMTTVKYA
jgi:FtsP/CotA-like multicopper oxidase with cupredoxin domain